MSDERLDEIELETSEEYEEITSDEVDSVVEKLEELVARVSSENIKEYLDQACQQIYSLVYDEDEEDEADEEEELLDGDDPLTDEDDLAAEAA